MKKYNYTHRYTEEFEMQLRKSLLEIEKEYNNFNSKIAFETSLKELVENNNVIHTKTMIGLDCTLSEDEEPVVVLPEGDYITFYFDDNFYDNKKYYNKVLEYINNNKIDVIGEFYEIHEMTRVSKDGETKSLAKIEILIR